MTSTTTTKENRLVCAMKESDEIGLLVSQRQWETAIPMIKAAIDEAKKSPAPLLWSLRSLWEYLSKCQKALDLHDEAKISDSKAREYKRMEDEQRKRRDRVETKLQKLRDRMKTEFSRKKADECEKSGEDDGSTELDRQQIEE